MGVSAMWWATMAINARRLFQPRLYVRRREAPRLWFAFAACAALCVALPAGVWAQPATAPAAWPSKPLRIIVPVVPGSFTDLAGRALAGELTEALGQSVLVENRPGAGTTIGAGVVAKASADGYTLLMTENSFSIAPALYGKLPFDPVRDFQPVALIAEAPTVWFARLELAARTPKDLVQLARTRPGELTYGTGGNGTSSHLAAELFIDRNKLKMIHVPFKGVAASIAEVIAGRVDVGTSSVASAVTAIQAGRMRALAVTGKERNALLPEVPTFQESGFGDYDMPIWFGIIAPAGLPKPILERLFNEIARAGERPRLRDLFVGQGARPMAVPPPAFAKRVESEIALWREVVPRVGIRPD
ncbi:MAG: tripartite tricarboxylate transporter substrate binding protein [Proteobacteria bacterium]|nr:tripartite tricarboxylate transporter substrate binding protein [Burkholderiales bacterium]